MKTNVKKSILSMAVVAILLSLTAFAVLCTTGYSASAETSGYNSMNWEVSNGGSLDYTINDDSIVIDGNSSWKSNYLLTDSIDAVGDYTMSATFSTDDATSGIKWFGIVPYYVDSNNYLIVGMKLDGDVLSQSVCMNVIGVQNGNHTIDIYDYSTAEFIAKEWNDIWLDGVGSGALNGKKINSGEFTITVTKKHGDEGSAGLDGDILYIELSYLATGESEPIVLDCGFKTINMQVNTRHDVPKVGLFNSLVSNLTVTNFTVTDAVDSTTPYASTGIYDFDTLAETDFVTTGVTKGDDWTYNSTGGGTYSVIADTDVEILTGVYAPSYALTETNIDGNYKVESNINITSGNSAGVVAWYKDRQNYILANAIAESDSSVKFELSGYVGGVAITPVASSEYSIDKTNIDLTVSKTGTTIAIDIGNGVIADYSDNGLVNSYYVGMTAKTSNATFTNFAIEEVSYNAFDEYNLTLNSKSFVASSNSTLDFSYSTENSLYSIDASDFEKIAYLYQTRVTQGENTVSADFSDVVTDDDDSISYGVMPYVIDKDNYVTVMVNASKQVVITEVVSGTASSLSPIDITTNYATFDIESDNELSVNYNAGKISVSINDTEIATDIELASFTDNNFTATGVAIKDGQVSFAQFTNDGYLSYQAVTVGEFTATGPSIDTWYMEDDAIVANLTEAGNFKSVSATKYLDSYYDTYFVGAEITPIAYTSTERKIGFIPWYIDGDNHLYVWVSQWDGAEVMLTLTGRINGSAVGNEWRETSLSSVAFFDTSNNAITTQMEVKIEGDYVRVFVNGNYSSSYNAQFEGLENAMDTKGNYQVGVNAFGMAVEFAGFTVSEGGAGENNTAGRIYGDTTAPTIELVMGSQVTTGTVGSSISLPTYTVSDDSGVSLSAEIVVRDPSNNAVEVASNKFTPSATGEYVVTISAKDLWGNEATPITWTIVVSKEGSSDGDSSGQGGTTEEQSGGCGSAMGSIGSIIIATLALIGMLAIVTIRRVKKGKKA